MPEREAVLRELAMLRRGWSLNTTALRERIGPNVARWFRLPANANDHKIVRSIREVLRQLASELGEDDWLAITYALGLQPGSQLPHLHERIRLLAEHRKMSERTARRRVERAFIRLAEHMVATPYNGHSGDGREDGWQVRRLKALVRLDKPQPEVIEERQIVATRNDLRRISVRRSIPRRNDGTSGERKVVADVLHGAVIEHEERLGDGHFHYMLGLPRPLGQGDEHTYTMAFRIVDGQPIRAYYAFVPLTSCEFFQVRVRFDMSALPRSVWRLDRLPSRVLDDPIPPGPVLPLDGAGEVEISFADVDVGYGYGVYWLPPEGK